MSELYKTIEALCEKKGISVYRLCKDINIRGSVLSDLNTGRKQGLSTKTLSLIAEYFSVSTDYLIGKEEAPASGKRSVSDEELMFALWGNSDDVDKGDLEDVRRYAQFVHERKKGK